LPKECLPCWFKERKVAKLAADVVKKKEKDGEVELDKDLVESKKKLSIPK
jgi:hypothetical protein